MYYGISVSVFAVMRAFSIGRQARLPPPQSVLKCIPNELISRGMLKRMRMTTIFNNNNINNNNDRSRLKSPTLRSPQWPQLCCLRRLDGNDVNVFLPVPFLLWRTKPTAEVKQTKTTWNKILFLFDCLLFCFLIFFKKWSKDLLHPPRPPPKKKNLSHFVTGH